MGILIMVAPKRVKNPIADLEKHIALVEAALEKARLKSLSTSQKALVALAKQIASVEKKVSALTAKGAKRAEIAPHQKELVRLQKEHALTTLALADVEQKIYVATEVASLLGVSTEKPVKRVTAKKARIKADRNRGSDVADKKTTSPAKKRSKKTTVISEKSAASRATIVPAAAVISDTPAAQVDGDIDLTPKIDPVDRVSNEETATSDQLPSELSTADTVNDAADVVDNVVDEAMPHAVELPSAEEHSMLNEREAPILSRDEEE